MVLRPPQQHLQQYWLSNLQHIEYGNRPKDQTKYEKHLKTDARKTKKTILENKLDKAQTAASILLTRWERTCLKLEPF